MRATRLNRLTATIVAMLVVLAACGPISVPLGAAGTGAAVTPTAKTLESTLGKRDDTVPVIQSPAPTVTAEVVQASAISLQDTLMAVYREANPSVVYIVVTSGTGFAASGGSGSGFVYGEPDGSGAGYIVTNNHVVEAGDSYEIVFSNGDRESGELVGTDPDSDLAVLRVESLPDGVAPIPLANDPVAVGQLAVAIGNPFGEQGSMSFGIISGLDRSLPSQRTTTTGSTYSLPQVIQTDAPINPGNSGGPLLNLQGEVIGVNAAIATTTGTNSGVGFSIPVDVVKRVAPSLISEGKVTYSYMGVSFDGEISLSELDLYGISQTRGAYVISVTPGSPADQAGLVGADIQTGQGGDLIIAIDGQPINDFSDLNSYLVLHTEVGQTLELTVLRDGQTLTLPLTLGARP